jgi:hypothetical protein
MTVARPGAAGKVWLRPVRIECAYGFGPADSRRMRELVFEHSTQRAHYGLIGAGIGIRWPELDEDISVPRLFGLSC